MIKIFIPSRILRMVGVSIYDFSLSLHNTFYVQCFSISERNVMAFYLLQKKFHFVSPFMNCHLMCVHSLIRQILQVKQIIYIVCGKTFSRWERAREWVWWGWWKMTEMEIEVEWWVMWTEQTTRVNVSEKERVTILKQFINNWFPFGDFGVFASLPFYFYLKAN